MKKRAIISFLALFFTIILISVTSAALCRNDRGAYYYCEKKIFNRNYDYDYNYRWYYNDDYDYDFYYPDYNCDYTYDYYNNPHCLGYRINYRDKYGNYVTETRDYDFNDRYYNRDNKGYYDYRDYSTCTYKWDYNYFQYKRICEYDDRLDPYYPDYYIRANTAANSGNLRLEPVVIYVD